MIRKPSFLFIKLGIIFATLLQFSLAIADDDERLIVFGDSLSDPGNAFIILEGQQSIAPFNLIPDAPYAIGGHHFTNGRTWVEQLAKKMRSKAKPAFAFNGGTNFAVGGSRARNVGPINLTSQVALYQSLFVADDDDLIVMMIGGNDVRDAIEALLLDPSGATSQQILTDAITSIQANLVSLINSGAEEFLVSNAPDLSLTPAVRAAGPEAAFAAHFLSLQFNLALAELVQGLSAVYDVEMVQFDLLGAVTQVAANHKSFGFSNATDSCITPGVIIKAICANPNSYMFWDGIHPTKNAHRIIARKAYRVIED